MTHGDMAYLWGSHNEDAIRHVSCLSCDGINYVAVAPFTETDQKGTCWTSPVAVQEEATALVGRSADEMQALKDAASPEFDFILNAVNFKACAFKMRISEETWQDEQRIRINIVR